MSTNNKDKSYAGVSYGDLFDLRGKVAVVTGGAGILGEHFCIGLAESGADVAIVDLKSERASEIAKAISKRFDVKVLGYGCDVSDPMSVKATVQKVVKDFGKINILHNLPDIHSSRACCSVPVMNSSAVAPPAAAATDAPPRSTFEDTASEQGRYLRSRRRQRKALQHNPAWYTQKQGRGSKGQRRALRELSPRWGVHDR